MAIAAFNTSSLEAVRTAIDAAEATGDPVPAEFIVNLGLLAHAEVQVFILQALMGIFVTITLVPRSWLGIPPSPWSRPW